MIAVESIEEVGSTFTFYFKYYKARHEVDKVSSSFFEEIESLIVRFL